jgi:hypothetical protein
MVNKPRMAAVKKQRTGKIPSRNSYASNKEVPSFTAPPLSPSNIGKGSSFHEQSSTQVQSPNNAHMSTKASKRNAVIDTASSTASDETGGSVVYAQGQ